MKERRFKFKLSALLVLIVVFISFLFMYVLPDTAYYLLAHDPNFMAHSNAVIFWLRLIPLPIYFCVYLLFKVVLRIEEVSYFNPLNVKNIKMVSLILKFEMLACIVAFIFILAPLPIGPGILIIVLMLLAFGYMVATFFDFLAYTMEQGHIIKEEHDLTI